MKGYIYGVSLLIYVILAIAYSTAAPYGGWGPYEGLGHTGGYSPKRSENSLYGYDFKRVMPKAFHNSRFNQRRKSRKLKKVPYRRNGNLNEIVERIRRLILLDDTQEILRPPKFPQDQVYINKLNAIYA
ncbi:uncharacterized protein [Lepeophtheirus salmonis]|uniref:Uncharacterized protein n=1 Tax=Lepeophtheirus salmonis TaxID=72036 RepID=A0A0K2UWS4_LEPSM|nr:uncharacterized protein LOC121129601 [Lepeophtheirus salmonis]